MTCPFCGAPHGESVPAGVVQVRCNYCGAEILVPPRLGGEVRRCPNHPDSLAVGLCNECGKSFCDQCLFLWETGHGKLHLCSKCYGFRNSMGNVATIISFIFSIIFLLFFFVIVMSPLRSGGSLPVGALVAGIVLMVTCLGTLGVKKSPVSIREFRSRGGSTAFLKKCANCGKEIPIASEQCQHCSAPQPEYGD